MIIRTRRKNESLVRRIFGRTSNRNASEHFLEEEAFQRELVREIYRSDRRNSSREFGLIRLILPDSNSETIELDDDLVLAIRERLRVSDSIGWYRSTVAFLLPETDKDGTLSCANSIAKVAAEGGWKVDTEVSVYPGDDELISLADELKLLDESDDNDDSNTINPPHVNWKKDDERGADSKDSDSGDDSLVKMTKYAFVKPHPTPWWKRAIDIVGAGTGLLMLSPIFLVAAIGIKLSSKGPVFFRQMREGKNGRQFGILKFRTMVTDAEAKQAELLALSEQDGPAFKLTNDPRVTKIGRYLRKSCVDELPQLYNVLIGEMSLVGPRPLPVHESFGCKARHRARLTVLPGLTCTWQAHGGRDVKFDDWMRMDLDYIENRGFWYDLKLIFETAFIAILHKGSV